MQLHNEFLFQAYVIPSSSSTCFHSPSVFIFYCRSGGRLQTTFFSCQTSINDGHQELWTLSASTWMFAIQSSSILWLNILHFVQKSWDTQVKSTPTLWLAPPCSHQVESDPACMIQSSTYSFLHPPFVFCFRPQPDAAPFTAFWIKPSVIHGTHVYLLVLVLNIRW